MSEQTLLLSKTEPPKWAKEILQVKNIFIITFLILQTTILVLQKVVSQPMYNYSYVLTLSQACCTTIGFALLLLVQAVYDYYRHKQALKRNNYNINEARLDFDKNFEFRSQSWEQSLTSSDYIDEATLKLFADKSDQRKYIPKYTFAILGGLFVLSNFLNYTGLRGSDVSGPIVVILQQTVVPFTMIFSLLFLRTRYRVLHYVGASLILIGVIFSVWDRLFDSKFDTPIWSILLVLSATVPLSVAITLMDYTLHNRKLSIYGMWFWINAFEVFIAVPLLFIVLPIKRIPYYATLRYLSAGYQCLFFGQNTFPDDQCQEVGWLFVAYVIALIANKSNQAFLIRQNSGTLMWIAATCAVPLAELIFTSKLIFGEKAASFSGFIVGGLVTVLIGLILYRSTKERIRSTL